MTRVVYLDRRLRNRLTYIEWDKQLMGPICDTMGVEQGGSGVQVIGFTVL
jgi:hypothetical protein